MNIKIKYQLSNYVSVAWANTHQRFIKPVWKFCNGIVADFKFAYKALREFHRHKTINFYYIIAKGVAVTFITYWLMIGLLTFLIFVYRFSYVVNHLYQIFNT